MSTSSMLGSLIVGFSLGIWTNAYTTSIIGPGIKMGAYLRGEPGFMGFMAYYNVFSITLLTLLSIYFLGL